MSNYQYQIPAANKVFEMVTSGLYKAAVLAAAPNAGKSTIIIRILNMYFAKYPDAKVVVLAHNQNVLKEQMLDGFTDGFVKPEFTFGSFGSNTQVEVGLPSSRSKIKSMDLLVIDESHQYVHGCKMLAEILSVHNPKHQVHMTGTPGCYNDINSKSYKPVYGMYYISGEELVDLGVYSYVVLDVVEASNNSVIDTYETCFKKLSTDKRFNPTKIMIACKSISDANLLGLYLKNEKGRNVAISTSENDSSNEEIKRYKSDNADVLIVVNRGILGFSDNNTTALIDLKSSKDIDARNQLFSRILRKHPKGIEKFYISAAKKSNLKKEIKMVYTVAQLMNKKNFQTYIN